MSYFDPPTKPAAILVVGRPGAGKTYYLCQLANGWPGRVLSVSPMDDDPPAPRDLGSYADTYTSELPPAWGDELDASDTKKATAQQLLAGYSLLVVDEADEQAGHSKDKQHPLLMWLLKRYRHVPITIALATQRPALVNRTARSLATYVVAFRVTDARDLAALAELPDSDELVARVPHLGVGECVVWTPNDGVITQSAD